jgi:hypothetical protein
MASAAECVRFERDSFGALHQMMAALNEQQRDDAWSETRWSVIRERVRGRVKCPFAGLSRAERRRSRTYQPLGYNGLPV